eukprot:m.151030 g.151030  ORF g.151030 m.151030 type:complete len:52 (+) comp17844_c0_seq2:1167-1322(+)
MAFNVDDYAKAQAADVDTAWSQCPSTTPHGMSPALHCALHSGHGALNFVTN